MGYSCNIAGGCFCLNSLFVSNKALPATRGFQPLRLLFLLPGIASEVVDLAVAASMRDDVSHGGMIASSTILTIGMSRAESELRPTAKIRLWVI
jgi:hypothetical protein